jgi:hypothetical protein
MTSKPSSTGRNSSRRQNGARYSGWGSTTVSRRAYSIGPSGRSSPRTLRHLAQVCRQGQAHCGLGSGSFPACIDCPV